MKHSDKFFEYRVAIIRVSTEILQNKLPVFDYLAGTTDYGETACLFFRLRRESAIHLC